MATNTNVYDVSDLEAIEEEECGNVNVRCVVTQLPPMKTGKNKKVKYFHGKLTDGKSTMKLVGFEPKLRTRMDKAQKEKNTVVLSNCFVKESVYEEGREVMATIKTKVMLSPKKLKVIDDVTSGKKCELVGIDEEAINSVVTVKGKVTVGEVMSIKSRQKCKDLKKQDCKLGDTSGTFKLVLWEGNVDQVKCGMSYEFTNLMVKEFDGMKYLTFSDETTVTETGNIEVPESVVDVQSDVDSASTENENIVGEVIAVVSSEKKTMCVSCNGEVNRLNERVGKCIRCGSLLKLTRCSQKVYVKFIVENEVGDTVTLCAYDELVQEMMLCVSGAEFSLEESLLSLPVIKYTFTKKHTVIAVEIMDLKKTSGLV